MSDRCSVAARAAELPVFGTAKTADFLVAIEQPGGWPARVFESPKLDPKLAEIEKAVAAAGGATVLIRRDPDVGRTERQIFLAGGFTTEPWLLGGRTDDLESVLTFARTQKPPAWVQPQLPALLICTNGSRDRCCAIEARPVIEALAGRADVWEASHLGGHRFAPTGIVLPTGQMLARITPALATDALAAALIAEPAPASLGPFHDRGTLRLAPEQQAAISAVRAETGFLGRLTVADHDDQFLVQSSDDAWLVTVSRELSTTECAESCGKTALPQWFYQPQITADYSL